MKVIIASTNPAKIAAVQQGFVRMFPNQLFTFEGVDTPSGVSDQPRDEVETLSGAMNRTNNASQTKPDANYWVGLESGIATFQDETLVFSWVVIKSHNGHYGKGRTASFFLPTLVTKLLNEGQTLGEADKQVFGRERAGQANGIIGLLTNDVMPRTAYLTEAVITALIPFKNPQLYF